MKANKTLPVVVSKTQQILRTLFAPTQWSSNLSRAGTQLAPSESRKIVELAGAQWVGVQMGGPVPIIMFRDPVTLSTLALYVDLLTVASVQQLMLESRQQFGVAA